VNRYHYRLELGGSERLHYLVREGMTVRPLVRPDDLDALASLMVDAYRGTIDYDGEEIDEAVAEVQSYFDGEPIDAASTIIEVDGEVVSACLVGGHEGGAMVGYVMTAPSHKEQGLGRMATFVSIGSLQGQGFTGVHAWITEGNVPSEKIFLGLGFEGVD